MTDGTKVAIALVLSAVVLAVGLWFAFGKTEEKVCPPKQGLYGPAIC